MTTSALPGFQVTSSQNVLHNHVVIECGDKQEEEEDSSTHCPDFALTVDREQQCLVLTLLGTRITPAPCMHDIIMDLRAGSQPFMGGEAHAGMAIGAENILAKVEEHLTSALTREPEFSLLVIGYSLGAGLAQLVTARLLEGPEASLVEATKVKNIMISSLPLFLTPPQGV